MPATTFDDIVEKVVTNYGDLIIKGFTQYGPGNELVRNRSIIGCLQEQGRVVVGGADGSDRYVRDWGVHVSTPSSTAYGAGDTYDSASPNTFDSAYMAWKRRHITLSWDDLDRATSGRSAVRGGHPVNFDLMSKLKTIINDIENDGIGDGTGTSGKVFTGFKAFLSTSNTYANIAQGANSFWQAQIDSTGGALSKSLVESMMETLDGVDATKPGLQIWMPLNQWNRYKNLYVDSIRYTQNERTGEAMVPVYDNGAFSAPIKIIRNMPTTEVWFININDIALHFCDQMPNDELKDLGKGQVRTFEGLPIGFKWIPENSDTSTVVVRTWGNYVCSNPRHQGALTGLTA